MKTLLSKMKSNPHVIVAVLICAGLILYAYACESQVRSILHPTEKVTRDVLQAEVDYLIDIGKARFSELDRKDAWKAALYNQFQIADESGTLNPAGMISMFFGLGGVTALINNAKLRWNIRNGNKKNPPPNGDGKS